MKDRTNPLTGGGSHHRIHCEYTKCVCVCCCCSLGVCYPDMLFWDLYLHLDPLALVVTPRHPHLWQQLRFLSCSFFNLNNSKSRMLRHWHQEISCTLSTHVPAGALTFCSFSRHFLPSVIISQSPASPVYRRSSSLLHNRVIFSFLWLTLASQALPQGEEAGFRRTRVTRHREAAACFQSWCASSRGGKWGGGSK